VVFRRLIGVFAQREHPLALFLDDLQWLDAATLNLLEDLLTQADVRHLLLIGAYRDNEVDAAHPLMRKLAVIQQAGVQVQRICLAPLAREHLGQLIADAVRCEPERAAPLAQVVNEKTAGNPFFAIQFLYALADEGLLRFDHGAARWFWDRDRIQAKGYTENVVDLMVGKIARLPAKTQTALQQLACLGNAAGITMLAIALGTSEEDANAALFGTPCVRVGRAPGRLLQVRPRQGAGSRLFADPGSITCCVPPANRRLLAAHTPSEKRPESAGSSINSIVAPLITEQDEREQLAELNLLAGKRA
jgi:predicted ATPase